MQVFHTVKGGKHYESMHERLYDLVNFDERYLCVIDGRLTLLDSDLNKIKTFDFGGSVGDINVLNDKIILKVNNEDDEARLVFLDKQTFEITSEFQATEKYFIYTIISNNVYLVSFESDKEKDIINLYIIVIDMERKIQVKNESFKFSKNIFPSWDKLSHEYFNFDMFKSQGYLLLQIHCNFVDYLIIKLDNNLNIFNQFPVSNMKLFYSNGSEITLYYQYKAFDHGHFGLTGLKRLDNNMRLIWSIESGEKDLLISNGQIHTVNCIYDIFTGKIIKIFDANSANYVGKNSRIIGYDNEMYFLNDRKGLILADKNMHILHQLPIFSYSLIFENDRIIGIDHVICKTNRGEAGYQRKSVSSIFIIKNSSRKIVMKVDDPIFYTDDNKRQFENLSPSLIKGRMFVDVDEFLRPLGGMMECYTNYIYEDYDMTYFPIKSIRLYPDKPIAKFRIDINTMGEILIDRDRTITPKLIGGVMYAPLRFICDRFGLKLTWDQKTKTATVTAP